MVEVVREKRLQCRWMNGDLPQVSSRGGLGTICVLAVALVWVLVGQPLDRIQLTVRLISAHVALAFLLLEAVDGVLQLQGIGGVQPFALAVGQGGEGLAVEQVNLEPAAGRQLLTKGVSRT